ARCGGGLPPLAGLSGLSGGYLSGSPPGLSGPTLGGATQTPVTLGPLPVSQGPVMHPDFSFGSTALFWPTIGSSCAGGGLLSANRTGAGAPCAGVSDAAGAASVAAEFGSVCAWALTSPGLCASGACKLLVN